MGVSSMRSLSRRLPICASERTPCSVPYTVTSLCPPLATSFSFTVAVSPARSERFLTSSAVNPAFETWTA